MLKRLDKKEMAEIYETRMEKDFPPAELKPWKRIEEMLDAGVYFAYGMFEEERLVAYAFFVEAAGGRILLDYYAVAEQARGTGNGSRCMEILEEELRKKGSRVLLIEVENPAWAQSEEERQNRERRIRFYEKNGAALTELRSCLFGVEYKIMQIPVGEPKGERELREDLEEIYRTMFPERYFGREVILYRD